MKQTLVQILILVGITLVAGTAYNMVGRKENRQADGSKSRDWTFRADGAKLRFFVDPDRYPDATVCKMGDDEEKPKIGSGKSPANGGEPVTKDNGSDPDPVDDPDGKTANPGTGVDPPDPSKIPQIGYAAAKQAWADGTLFIDARSAEDYAEGHIPGAMSIPAWEADIDELIQQVASEEGTSAPVVIYCNRSDECEDSHIVGNRMKLFDFVALEIFEGGLPGWKENGGTVFKGEDSGPRGSSE